jgi:hypothetical protein
MSGATDSGDACNWNPCGVTSIQRIQPSASSGIRNRLGAVSPTRDLARRLVGARRGHRDLLAALGELRKLGGEAIERRGQRVERIGKSRARKCHVARLLADRIARRKAELPDRGNEVGGGVGKVRNVAGRGACRDLGIARELGELPGRDLLAEEQRRGVRQLVRFVEDDRIAVGQELRPRLRRAA